MNRGGRSGGHRHFASTPPLLHYKGWKESIIRCRVELPTTPHLLLHLEEEHGGPGVEVVAAVEDPGGGLAHRLLPGLRLEHQLPEEGGCRLQMAFEE